MVTRLRMPLSLYRQIQRMAADEKRTAHNLMLVLLGDGYDDRNHNSKNGASR